MWNHQTLHSSTDLGCPKIWLPLNSMVHQFITSSPSKLPQFGDKSLIFGQTHILLLITIVSFPCTLAESRWTNQCGKILLVVELPFKKIPLVKSPAVTNLLGIQSLVHFHSFSRPLSWIILAGSNLIVVKWATDIYWCLFCACYWWHWTRCDASVWDFRVDSCQSTPEYPGAAEAVQAHVFTWLSLFNTYFSGKIVIFH